MTELILVMYFFNTFELDFNLPKSTAAYTPRIVEEKEMPSTGLPDGKGNKQAHAFCDSDSKKILINKNHWEKLPFVHKRELIYHELGHCVLKLGHNNQVSIMRPRVYSTSIDESNWEDLVEDMRKQK